MITRSVMTFDPIFRIFGIFYDLRYHFYVLKVSFCSKNIETKMPFLLWLAKWRKRILRGLLWQNQYNTIILSNIITRISCRVDRHFWGHFRIILKQNRTENKEYQFVTYFYPYIWNIQKKFKFVQKRGGKVAISQN